MGEVSAAVSRDQRQSTPDYDGGGKPETADAAGSPATQLREAGKRRRQDTPEYDEGGGSHRGAESQEETPSAANRPGEAAADDDGKSPATHPTSRKRVIPRMSVNSFYGPGISGAIAKIRETSLKQRYDRRMPNFSVLLMITLAAAYDLQAPTRIHFPRRPTQFTWGLRSCFGIPLLPRLSIGIELLNQPQKCVLLNRPSDTSIGGRSNRAGFEMYVLSQPCKRRKGIREAAACI